MNRIKEYKRNESVKASADDAEAFAVCNIDISSFFHYNMCNSSGIQKVLRIYE